ncbi:MAG: polyisoprenoid-binding protein YceI [Mariniblastus sp.]|jgi:polyisoprenoid-binding protein YceI
MRCQISPTPTVFHNLVTPSVILTLSLFANSSLHAVQVPTTAPAQTGKQTESKDSEFTIDNDHTSIIFAVSHFGLSYTYGRFNQCSGGFSLQAGQLTKPGFAFKIEADSIDTNQDERDKHLKGPDFFDTKNFPTIDFVTTEFTKVDGVYQVKGNMTMLGKTQPLTMPVQLVGIGTGPFGKQRAGFFTKFTIKRSDFGMDEMKMKIGDNISVTFSFEGIKK